MRLRSAAMAGMLLALALILTACGEEKTAAVDAPAAKRTATSDGAASVSTACGSQLRSFLGAMDALREQLAVGLNYADYLRGVRELNAAYGAIPVDRLQLACLTAAGTPGERALNRYVDAANAWGDCLSVISCDSESIEAALQRKWAVASDLLSAAQEGLGQRG